MWNFGKIGYFGKKKLKFQSKILCDYDCDYLPHTTFPFYSIDFQLNAEFPILSFLPLNLPRVTQRSVAKENALKKSKNPSAFLPKAIGSNNSFTLIENNFRFFR